MGQLIDSAVKLCKKHPVSRASRMANKGVTFPNTRRINL